MENSPQNIGRYTDIFYSVQSRPCMWISSAHDANAEALMSAWHQVLRYVIVASRGSTRHGWLRHRPYTSLAVCAWRQLLGRRHSSAHGMPSPMWSLSWLDFFNKKARSPLFCFTFPQPHVSLSVYPYFIWSAVSHCPLGPAALSIHTFQSSHTLRYSNSTVPTLRHRIIIVRNRVNISTTKAHLIDRIIDGNVLKQLTDSTTNVYI